MGKSVTKHWLKAIRKEEDLFQEDPLYANKQIKITFLKAFILLFVKLILLKESGLNYGLPGLLLFLTTLGLFIIRAGIIDLVAFFQLPILFIDEQSHFVNTKFVFIFWTVRFNIFAYMHRIMMEQALSNLGF